MTYYNRKKSAFADKEKGSASLTVAIIFGLFLLSVLYLAQANSIVAKNFQLRSARIALEEKRDSNQKMMVALMQAKSMASLEGAAKNLNLVAVENVDYLKVSSEFFALLQQP